MRTAVIYSSLSGFTRTYAEWIAAALPADLFRHRDICPRQLLGYDQIVYGGSLHAVGITGIRLIKRALPDLAGKRIIVFATGASPAKPGIVEEIGRANFAPGERQRITLFYLRGGFDFTRLDAINKLLMTLLKWKIMMKRTRTPDETGMLTAFEKPMDFTKKEYLDELLAFARS